MIKRNKTKACFNRIVFIYIKELRLLTLSIVTNLYIVAASVGRDVNVLDVIKGVMIFLTIEIIVLILLILFPSLSMHFQIVC